MSSKRNKLSKWTKNTLILFAGAALALSVAGCGKSAGSPNASSSAVASSPSPSAPAGTASPISSAQGNPLEVAGVNDPAAFKTMFAALKEAAASGDKAKVGEFALYPIRVNVGKVAVEVKDKEAFVKQYDRIFTDNVLKALAEQDADKLFANEEGVMVGTGEIWFGVAAETPQRYGIVTVNVGEQPRR